MTVADGYQPAAGRLDIVLQDARMTARFAASVGSPTPLLDAAIPVYEASSTAGLGHIDAAVLGRWLELSGGLRRSGS